ncbi:hypothetical protein PENSPDRAFT_619655 [Peniophora sp. CONT]|nr:hypothetical protein PENSPDRAFT_619655 [Peniophora sp. CONT]
MDENIQRSKILLLGQRRSGKTSIHRVLFDDAVPKETFYLEPTTRIEKHIYDTIIPLEIWDCPGNTTPDTLSAPLSDFDAVIYVIDMTDQQYQKSIEQLVRFAQAAYTAAAESIIFEVFVHKTDSYSEDYRFENFQQINARIEDDLFDVNLPETFVTCKQTSIYDHTLHASFSTLVHKLIGTVTLGFVEELCNSFCANAQASKAFLFDVQSRLYVATDASPVDAGTLALCLDYIKTLHKLAPLYTSLTATPLRLRPDTPPTAHTPTLSVTSAAGTATTTPARTPATRSPASPSAALLPSPSGGNLAASTPSLASAISSRTPVASIPPTPSPPPFSPSAAMSLAGGTTLTYHAAGPSLALLALLPSAVLERRRGLLEYNAVFFKEGVLEIGGVIRDSRNGSDGKVDGAKAKK